jgi:hypothetical protein
MILEKILGSLFVKENLARSGRNFTALEAEVNSHGAQINNLNAEVDNHKSEVIAQAINTSRDLSLAGIQTVSNAAGRIVKSIIAMGVVQNTKKTSNGIWGNGVQNCIYNFNDTGNSSSSSGVILGFSDLGTTNRTFGAITNVKAGSFDINWTHTGTGATGTAQVYLLVTYHD